MGYTRRLARKLTLSAAGRKRSPAVVVAIIAVALSIAVMLAAIAVVSGFKQEITDKVVGFNSDMVAYVAASAPSDGELSNGEEVGSNIINLTESLRAILDNAPYVDSYYLESTLPAVFKTENDFKGIYYKAYSGDAGASFLKENLVEGRLPAKPAEGKDLEILVSEIIANSLGLKVGDNIDTYFITDNIRVRSFKISGIFNTHFDIYDDIYVYGPQDVLFEISTLKPDQGTSLHILTKDFENIDDYTADIRQRFGLAYSEGLIYKPLWVDNAKSLGAGYFQWLKLLDTNVVVILVLMMIVGCITLVSGMLIIILDKRPFIGLMKALGATNRAIRRIFIFLTLRVAAIGIVFGNVLMLALLWIQQKYRIIPLDAASYYIDFVPVHLTPAAVIALNIGVLVVIALVLIFPSRIASRISPAETLRWE